MRKAGDGRGLDQRKIAVEHHDGALADAGGFKRYLDGMSGAQTLGLLHGLNRNVGIGVRCVEQCANLVGVAADNHHDTLASCGDGGVDDPLDHRLAQDLMRNLGVIGFHAGALAGCEDDGGCVHECSQKVEQRDVALA